MKILVTGGAGFIGSTLTQELLDKGYLVTILDNFSSYYNSEFKRKNIYPFLTRKNFTLVEGDITNTDLLNEMFKKNKFEKVIHLAASVGVRNSIAHPRIYKKNNIIGTQNMLDMVGKYGVEYFLFASSSSIYGNSSPMPFVENNVVDSVLSPYAQTKKNGEILCYEHHKKFHTSITVFRFFTVYGPKGRPDMAPYIFVESILKRKPIHIFGNGLARRDFTYSKDLVNGILLALNKNFPYEVFNLGSASPVSVIKFIRLIEKITGEKAKIEYKDRFLPEMKNTFADVTKAQKKLGFKQMVSVEEGLGEFIYWYKKNRI